MVRGEAAVDLASLPRFGRGIGLHRVAMLALPVLRGPWGRRLDAIKITGSNGKGSVAALTAAILEAAQVTTGVFTSPHLHRPEERIRIAGRPITPEALAVAHAWCRARWCRYGEAHPNEVLSAFEMWTAMLLRACDVERPPSVVAEAGIGGRYDPVRLVPGRQAVLASVDLEHQAWLGSTHEAIACDKADLAPPGGRLFVGPVPGGVRRALEGHLASRTVEPWFADDHVRVHALATDHNGSLADLEIDGRRFEALRIALAGRHQLENAALAIAVVQQWLARHRPSLDEAAFERAVRRGLGAVRLAGRFERVHTDPDVIVDVAHTPGATEALAETVVRHLGTRRIIAVVGVSTGRDVEPLLAPILDLASHVVVTQARQRGAPATRVAETVRRRFPHLSCTSRADLATALGDALTLARAERRTILVAGGLFLAAEARVLLRGEDRPPPALSV